MSEGKIVQIIGAVVDMEFPRGALPKVYDAIKMDSPALTFEVQQQLGDGIVRAEHGVDLGVSFELFVASRRVVQQRAKCFSNG